MLFAVILSLSLIPCLYAQFFNPVQRREVWRIGEQKIITYNTKFRNYTIALWQQSLVADAATIGDILFSIQDGSGPAKELTWTVETNNLDLDSSNVFFLWLFEGDLSHQGNFDFQQMSSAYFNITDELPIPKVTLTSIVDTTSMTQTSELPTSTQLPPSESSAETSTQQTTIDGGKTVSTGTPTASASQGSRAEPSGGLPVGAQAGIGVGVGIIGITCVICAITWCRYLRKHQKALHDLQEMALSQPPAYTHGSAGAAPATVEAHQSPVRSNGYYISPKPVEIA
ncbi:hypothetical protein CORC01_12737 [Colletotrichum orchidophilum]|uniref:Mid2 domain-containing protein n=1 Tax=Colletotrichum orchidophilum TaxID=1209926 RepID=A0A1G4AS13_9PEZI|nr:uncharacterized protein CORC01_12737 [Colletotrichum orchidophilum]OHE91949.1 hypothetical protein CORC01_12737 [Colletotrichum orchidophilum]